MLLTPFRSFFHKRLKHYVNRNNLLYHNRCVKRFTFIFVANLWTSNNSQFGRFFYF